MNRVKVEKENLIATLKKNRDEHRSIFLEAQETYRKQVIKELNAMLKEAREGKRIRRTVSLTQPEDHTSEYNAAIRMMEMSVEAEIELSASDFSQYVLDQWGWSRQFMASNRGYSAKAAMNFDAMEGA